MDPFLIIEGIAKCVESAKTLFDLIQEYRQSDAAVTSFLLFMDNMALVLKEQDRSLVPDSGVRMLRAIEQECEEIVRTASRFVRRCIAVRVLTAGSTVAELQQARVRLNECWMLYLVCLSPAGSARLSTPAVASRELRTHMNTLSAAVEALSSSDAATAATADQILRDLSYSPTGQLTQQQEAALLATTQQLREGLGMPAAFARGDARTHFDAMQDCMINSVNIGMQGFAERLAELAQQNTEMLSLIQNHDRVLDAIMFGDSVAGTGALEPDERELLERHHEALGTEQDAVMAEDLMACPILGNRFTTNGGFEPVFVPGCHCVVSRVMAQHFVQRRRCAVCRTRIATNVAEEPLRRDNATRMFMQAVEDDRVPRIPKFHFGEFEEVPEDMGTRYGAQGFVRSGTLRGEAVAVKTIEFSHANDPARLQRCRRHILLNSVCLQHRAAQESQFVCPIVAVCWEKHGDAQVTRAHIAMPLFLQTLEEHVDRNAPRGMPVQLLLRLCAQLTRAVEAVHRLGVLHCDIKPANVLLADDGSPRLADFGISRCHGSTLRTSTSMTAIGHASGYAAPEQEMQRRVSRAADFYALGRTLAFAGTGCNPCPMTHEQDMPPEPAELREQVEALVAQDVDMRRQIDLFSVVTHFEYLSSLHGPEPAAAARPIASIADLTDRLAHAFGNPMDLGGVPTPLGNNPTVCTAPCVASAVEDLGMHFRAEGWKLQEESHVSCWSLRQGGSILSQTSFELPANGQLHVSNEQSNGAWHNVTITGRGGSAVLVSGRLTMERVVFDSCTLVATSMAALTLRDCTFRNARLAIYISSDAESLHLQECHIDACDSGVYIARGGKLSADGKCGIACTRGCCVLASGSGATAELGNTVLTCAHSATAIPSDISRGCLAVIGGASADLCGGEMAGNGNGVVAYGVDSTASVTRCPIQVAAAGAWACEAGSVVTRGCVISGCQRPLYVTGSGSRLEAEDCQALACQRSGADARRGGVLRLKGCLLSGSVERSGISVDGEGSVAVAEDCDATKNKQCGMFARAGGRLEAKGSFAGKNFGDCVCVDAGATVELTDCKLHESKHWGGLLVQGAGSWVKAVDCDVSRNRMHGVRVLYGAYLDAKKCTAFENGSREAFDALSASMRTRSHSRSAAVPAGSDPLNRVSSTSWRAADAAGGVVEGGGFFVSGVGSKIIAAACTASRNCSSGMATLSKAELWAGNCTCAENGGPNISAQLGAAAHLHACTLSGSTAASGLDVDGIGSTADAAQCGACENAECGMVARNGAEIKLGDQCSAGKNRDTGVMVDGPGSKVAATSIEIPLTACKNSGFGILARNKAVLEVIKCVVDTNKRAGISVLALATATIRECSLSGSKGDSGLVADGDGVNVSVVACNADNNYLYGMMVKDGAKLEVWDSFVRENRLAGVRVGPRAYARLQNCHLLRSRETSGIVVHGGRHKTPQALVVNCTISQNAQYGITVQDQATLRAKDVTAKGNGEAGICVQSGGEADLQSCRLCDSTRGSGLYVSGTKSTAAARVCHVSGNAWCGMSAEHGGRVEDSGSDSQGNSKAGFSINAYGTMTLTQSKSEDTRPYRVPGLPSMAKIKRIGCTPP